MRTRYPVACEPWPRFASPGKQRAALGGLRERLAAEIDRMSGPKIGKQASRRLEALLKRDAKVRAELEGLEPSTIAAVGILPS